MRGVPAREVLHQRFLRLEHKCLRLRVPEPHHQHLLSVQLEQHCSIAVAVAVPVGKVDALKRLPRVALQGDGIAHRVVQGLYLVVEIKIGAVRMDAHQHIGVLAAAGDGAAVPDDAGDTPVTAHHIAGVVVLTAAGGKAQTQCQRR